MKKFSVEIKDLEFRYQALGPLLKINSLSVVDGQKVFIKAPSGAGKTTLLSLMGGILIPQKGLVKVLDQDLSKLSESSRDDFRAEHLGFVFQLFNLIPYLSVEENIVLPLLFSKARRTRVENRFNSQKEAARFYIQRLGLQDLNKDQSASELSVGQQQRVALARALIGSPEMIIADEPTSALDEDREEDFMKLLLDETKDFNPTIIFVSHQKRLAKYFDQTIELTPMIKEGAL